VLIQLKDKAMPKGEDGHVLLWRQVIFVNLEGRLDVAINAYSKHGDMAAVVCRYSCPFLYQSLQHKLEEMSTWYRVHEDIAICEKRS
jgi:hypothetical protein